MVSLVVKSHSQSIIQGLKDVISDLVEDLEIVARNGSFLTSKLLVFGIFPHISSYLCGSCASGHDTVTIVIPDTDVEVVREAFDKLFDGDITEIDNILGCEKNHQNLQNIQKSTLEEVVYKETDTEDQELEALNQSSLQNNKMNTEDQTAIKNNAEDQLSIKVET